MSSFLEPGLAARYEGGTGKTELTANAVALTLWDSSSQIDQPMRVRGGNELSGIQNAADKHFTPQEPAKGWAVSPDTIRKIFQSCCTVRDRS